MGEPKTFGQWSFNGGELSPRMVGRVDQNVYGNGLDTMLGWLPLLQGPATAAPGTIFVELASGACRLFPFEFSPTQGYVIEASAGKFRFFTNDTRIETAPGVAYEVAHTYSLAELQALTYWQSNDVLYLAGANKPPKKLTRTDATHFTLSDVTLTEGPIDIGNGNEGVTLTVSGTTGNINITANSAMFAATDVGSFLEIVAHDFNNVPSWEPGMTGLAPGDQREWGGRIYQLVSILSYTGGNPPEHDEGTAWDGSTNLDINGKGPYGARWLYLYNAYGLVKITGYTSPTQVAATVVKRLADSVITTPTSRWAFGSFSNTRGWPETVGGWNSCLVFTKGNRVFTSVIDDFENFGRRDTSGDFQRDLAGGFTLSKQGTIRWQASDRLLLLGSDTDEYTIERVQVNTASAGPPVFDIKLQSSNGSAASRPIQADGRILFLQRAGRKLREFGYAIQNDRYLAPDVTRLADHITAPGMTELAWQAEPERFAWLCRDDGLLACMTYDPEQQVMGWARRELGGGLAARSICRITDPLGKHDQLWIAAEAQSGDWLVLRMAKMWEYGDDPGSATFVDAALAYDGAPAQHFSNLDHLEGQSVDILADGKPHRALVVAGGAVMIDYPASQVHIGVPFPAILKTLPPEVGQDEGVARGKIKRVLDVTVHFSETQGVRISVQGCDPIELDTRSPDAPLDLAAPLFSDVKRIPTVGTYDRMGQVKIERFQPTPATVLAIVPTLQVGEI